MNVLIVEDDAVLSDGISRTVLQMGHQPVTAADGPCAHAMLASGTFDLVLLDIGLPGMDGLTLLQRLREGDARTQVVLLTARDGVDDRIRGLDLGADDYVVKPVALSELAARIRAHLRRSQLESSTTLVHGPLSLDTLAHRAWLCGEELDLPTREWQVLDYMLRRPERVVTKGQLQLLVAGTEGVNYNIVEVYISRLRSKLETAGIRIRTVRGLGYMLEDYRAM